MSGTMSGARIRALRKRLGLSQVELAAYLGASNVTVNRWEKDRAAPRPATVERLLRLERDGLAEPSSASVPARQGNLPASFSPLIRRGPDLAALSGMIASSPLVTILGTAGVGKTRLAIEAGRMLAPRWTGGVWFVDLAAALEPGDVLHAAARVLGVREAGCKPLIERLASEYGAREMLLILDNCEHLARARRRLRAPVWWPGRYSMARATQVSAVPCSAPREESADSDAPVRAAARARMTVTVAAAKSACLMFAPTPSSSDHEATCACWHASRRTILPEGRGNRRTKQLNRLFVAA